MGREDSTPRVVDRRRGPLAGSPGAVLRTGFTQLRWVGTEGLPELRSGKERIDWDGRTVPAALLLLFLLSFAERRAMLRIAILTVPVRGTT